MALLACLDFELPWCDFLEPPSFVNRYGELASADDSQRVVVATNMFAMRRMHTLLVLPNSKAEPYASVARMLDETAHRAGVSDTRRASHPCPVVLDPHDAAPRWLSMSLRVMVSQLLVRGGGAAIPNQELWVLDHLISFPLTPAPPVFRLPFEVSELGHVVGHFYQPRSQSRWAPAGLVTRPRVELTQAESNWFYARLSAFAFYAYCTQLPPYAVWGAMRLFFDRVETIVAQVRCRRRIRRRAQDRNIEIEAFKIRGVNPALFDAWNRWNEHMALYAHWFVALYQVMERSSTCNLAPVKALVNGVVVETIQEPFRELRVFMSDARDYWPAMYSCQAEFSSLEPLLVPLQRVSRHEATALLQTRLCRRDMTAFVDASLPDEDPNCGSVCYRVPDMLPSHMRATLAHLGFAPEDIASVVMAPYFNGGADAHTYDLFVRMHARHECAWQVASICDLPRAARPLLQRLGCAPRGCLVNRPSVLRVVQRAVLRLCCGPSVTESLDFNAELEYAPSPSLPPRVRAQVSPQRVWCYHRGTNRGPRVFLRRWHCGARPERASAHADWRFRRRHAAQRQQVEHRAGINDDHHRRRAAGPDVARAIPRHCARHRAASGHGAASARVRHVCVLEPHTRRRPRGVRPDPARSGRRCRRCGDEAGPRLPANGVGAWRGAGNDGRRANVDNDARDRDAKRDALRCLCTRGPDIGGGDAERRLAPDGRRPAPAARARITRAHMRSAVARAPCGDAFTGTVPGPVRAGVCVDAQLRERRRPGGGAPAWARRQDELAADQL
jgi:hypothetical protein